MNSGVLSWKRTGGLDVRQVAARLGDRHFLANFRDTRNGVVVASPGSWTAIGPARDGCVAAAVYTINRMVRNVVAFMATM